MEWNNFFDCDGPPYIIAGPCSAESLLQLEAIARYLNQIGVLTFRAGAWKPRTLPNAFSGYGELALEWLTQIGGNFNVRIGTEVATTQQLEKVLARKFDYIWIGARTSGDPLVISELVSALKGVNIPVFIKNPLVSNYNLWVSAIEKFRTVSSLVGAIYRGFFSNNCYYRNAPMWHFPAKLKQDFNDICLLCDPSHMAGHTSKIEDIISQSLKVNFDGLFIEVHNSPCDALTDSVQQLSFPEFDKFLTTYIARYKKNEISQLEQLRLEIDSIDSTIIDAIAYRNIISAQIGELKVHCGLHIYQHDRCQSLFNRYRVLADMHSLNHQVIFDIFKIIHKQSIEIQTSIRK